MKKPKKQKILLHMHQLRNFIDNRHEFYQKYYYNNDPRSYAYKGVQKAFTMGSAVDFGIKTFYENLNKIEAGEKVNPGDGVLNSQEFKNLPSKVDQVIAMSLINAYISRYHSYEETKEYFHNFQIVSWNIPISSTRKVKLKNDYVIHNSPDVVAETLLENKLVIIEIKTSGEDDTKYDAETLDFQTMTYAWASYRWNFKIPQGVIKRTLFKPRIRLKKDETESEYIKRIINDISMNEEKYFKSNFREVNKEMILEYEKYLYQIIADLDSALTSNNKYKFYKKSKDYWGIGTGE